MSDLTRRAMADAVTELLKNRTLDHITIRDITDRCGLTRNTFYYHFHDVYELLSWIFTDKTEEIIRKYSSDEDWEDGLLEMLNFLYEHRKMVLHTYESVSGEVLQNFVSNVMYRHVEVIVSIAASKADVSKDAVRLAADFYTHAVIGAVLNWVSAEMPQQPEEMAHIYSTLFEGTLESVLTSSEKGLDGLKKE